MVHGAGLSSAQWGLHEWGNRLAKEVKGEGGAEMHSFSEPEEDELEPGEHVRDEPSLCWGTSVSLIDGSRWRWPRELKLKLYLMTRQ